MIELEPGIHKILSYPKKIRPRDDFGDPRYWVLELTGRATIFNSQCAYNPVERRKSSTGMNNSAGIYSIVHEGQERTLITDDKFNFTPVAEAPPQ